MKASKTDAKFLRGYYKPLSWCRWGGGIYHFSDQMSKKKRGKVRVNEVGEKREEQAEEEAGGGGEAEAASFAFSIAEKLQGSLREP